jgi:pyridoxamine 5'-phosphate oxidase
MLDIAQLRRDYSKKELTEKNVDESPFIQFSHWFKEALEAEVPEPNAMTLATATKDGRPSARVMLLKYFGENGFGFFTNFNSRKSLEIAENPYAALCFLWLELERQVRVDGLLHKIPDKEAEEYFKGRPRGSQIGAWVSHQSSVIKSKEELEKKVIEMEKKFDGREVPIPDYWGGYTLIPTSIEFWQGRPSRLHDRILYTLDEKGEWKTSRLSP